MPTWTPAALSANTRRLSGRCWRVVEAQHVVSTMALVDTLEEQALLEHILDESKPSIPAECRHLHYLLFTPFRYGALYPAGSRFRRPCLSAGVFYGSQEQATAVAELAFRRLLFFSESPATPWPANAAEYTSFVVAYATRKGLDLTRPPLDRGEKKWLDPIDYSHCHDLADAARAAEAQVLRYQSARVDGLNIALLSCAAFASAAPLERHVWRVHLGSMGVRAIGDLPEQRLAFDRNAFSRDPRIAALNWDR
ncbi:MAG: RES family NAD+ phosphorylase [Cyanobacteria bacterium]|nr:RES family NAD+ phosphorylase [Cyanobacteriota bacterium]